jgi:hypothetical protein
MERWYITMANKPEVMDNIKLEAMRELLKIQGSDGNWNLDEYMLGMYNGIELIVAIAEDREPVFKDAPDEWFATKPFELKVIPGGLSK